MRTLRRFTVLATALCALAAHAGLKLAYEMKRNGKTTAMTWQMEGKNLRMDGTKEGDAEARGAYIADGDGKRVMIVDYEKKEYAEITEEQMKALRAKMDVAMTQMKAQMAKLPPEQRAQMEKMMSQYMKGGAPRAMPEEKYVRASGSKKIAGYDCDLYKVEIEGKHAADACLISWADLKVDGAQLRQQLEAMQDFWGMGGTAARPAINPKAWGMDVGLPAWRKTLKDGGESVTETTLTSISQGAVPKDAFAPPAGFTRKSLGEKLEKVK
jgi:hypothetical protein